MNEQSFLAARAKAALANEEWSRNELGEWGGGARGPCRGQQIQLGESTSQLESVPPDQRSAVFTATWEGSDVVMSLTSPSGRMIDRSTTDADVSHELTATSERYSIDNPEPGDWTVTLFGADVPPEGEAVEVGVGTVPEPILVGDAQCDGRVDSIDAALILQLSAGLIGSLSCEDGADVNRDGQLNALDAALILQFDSGLISTLPP